MSRMHKVVVVAIVVNVTIGLNGGRGPVRAADPFAGLHLKLDALVTKHLSAKADYQPGDLITRSDVEPVFNELLQSGLPVSADAEGTYAQFLRDSDPLVILMRTSDGQKFMRKVSTLEGAYDRLERLSWLPEGQVVIQKLISDPKGAKVFAEMSTPQGMKLVAKRLATDPRGQNFALPTGHIHTAEQFVSLLEQTLRKQAQDAAISRDR